MTPTNRSLPQLSPASWLTLALVVVVAVSALAIWHAHNQPWLGITLAAGSDDAAPPRIVSVSGPAASLSSGRALIGLGTDGVLVSLRGADLTPEPDTRYPLFSDYRQFLQRQQMLHQQLLSTTLELRDDQGKTHTVHPLQERPLSDLPFAFWLQLLVAGAGMLIGVGVWAFRRNDRAAAYFAITGIGLMLSAATAAVYSTRELALAAPLFRGLHIVNGTGALLFCAAFLSTLWHYPTRLARRDPGPWILLLFMSLAAASALQWLPGFDESMRLPILIGFTATIALAVAQWRRTRAHPLERAALQWFLLAWFSGSTAFLALIFLPPLLGTDTGQLQAYAFALFLLIYIGVAFGIARYQLFQLDRWWLNAWSFLLSGVVLVLVDLLLIYTLHLDAPLAMALAVAFVGWIYFPLRQRILERLSGTSGHAALPQLLQNVIAAESADPETLWQETLQRLFQPLDQRELEATVAEPEVSENGLVLEVPGLGSRHGIRLTGCENGRRLFGARDIDLTQTVWAATDRLLTYRRAVDIGVERERGRVARDLHDDVGARLLELLHAADSGLQPRVRDVLDELRLVIHSLGTTGENLDDLLGMCRAELADRTESRGVKLSWSQFAPLPSGPLDPHQAMHIVRTLRESAVNALRHAQPQQLSVSIDYQQGQLEITIDNDGAPDSPEIPPRRRGLNALAGRAQALQGSVDISRPTAGGWRVTAQLPLQPQA